VEFHTFILQNADNKSMPECRCDKEAYRPFKTAEQLLREKKALDEKRKRQNGTYAVFQEDYMR